MRELLAAVAAAVVGCWLEYGAQDAPVTLLTIPQRDELRLRTSAASVSLSGDGRYVALTSYARLAPADTNDRADIYVLDRASGNVTLESLHGERPNITRAGRPCLNGDGRYLVFETMLPSGDGSTEEVNVVIRDRARDTTTRVSRSAAGGPSDGWSGDAAISDDGRIVVFASNATDLVSGRDENGSSADVYLLDATTGVIRRVSVDSHGAQRADGVSATPTLSADGRYVAFATTAALDLPARGVDVEEGRNSRRRLSQIYIRDTQLNLTRLVRAAGGAPPDGPSYAPVMSRDARYVAFVSEADNLASGDNNRSADIFLLDATSGSITLISRSAAGGAANGSSRSPAISADGRFIAFQSDASDLVCARRCPEASEDINLVHDVFVFDRVTGGMTLVSADSAGGWMEESGAPAMDASGRLVAFTSRHPIHPQDLANDFDLFVRISARP